MPVHTYTNWNVRTSDQEEPVEPYRKYFFICEGANTETFYFRHLIDIRKQLGINPLIDIRLWEKTEEDRDISFPRNLFEFAKRQKEQLAEEFDVSRDKMIVVFDGDIFEERVQGYDELIDDISVNDIAAVTNPSFELFLILHFEHSYENFILGNEILFMHRDEGSKRSHAYNVLKDISGMNSKKNPQIGDLAEKVYIAIEQEKKINQDVREIKNTVSSNIGMIIEAIINDKPRI